jgi:hypothetical protein
MARYSSRFVSSGAGTTLRPVGAVLSTATVSPVLRQVAMFNTTTTACEYRLVQFTGGTPGAGQTERRHRRNAPAASSSVVDLYTVDATIGEDTGYGFRLGAAVGSGVIETFGGEGLEGDLGATAGLGLVPVATPPGQICVVQFVFDE